MSQLGYMEKLLDGVEVEWKSLDDIAIKISSGGTPSTGVAEYYDGNIPWLRTQEVDFDEIWDTGVKITESGLKNSSAKWIPENCIIIAMYGATIGKIGILSFPATTNQACCACYEYSINQMFLFYFLLANRENFIAMGGGGAQPNISKEKIISTSMPLPPLKEQERIVAEIERWLSLVDIVEKEKSDLQSTICLAKSKILDLAIHGKLVPQDPNDEPASELLKRINPKAEITCDNPQYGKLPKGWCETTLGNTIVIKSGDAIKVRDNRIGKYPIYGGNGITGYNESYNVDGINIIIGRVGFYCGSVHYVNNKIWVTDNAFVTKIMGNVYTPKFLYYLLQQYDLKQYSNSTAQPVISGKTVYPINVMLPPLSEQYRIVARIEELFAQLDKIESSLQA